MKRTINPVRNSRPVRSTASNRARGVFRSPRELPQAITHAAERRGIISNGINLKNLDHGFTLVEFILYIGIISIVLLFAGTTSLNILFGKAKLATIEEINQNSRLVFTKMSEKIRSAESINSPPPAGSASSISLVVADSSKNPTLFDLANGRVRIQEGAGAAIDLTSSEVTVSQLEFTNVSYPNTAGTVRIRVVIKSTNPANRPEYQFENIFYTTASIRKKQQ